MRRFLKWKWLFRLGLMMAVLAIVVPVIGIVIVRYQGKSELDAVTAQLDTDDPNWRLDDLTREYNANLPPPDRNTFTVARKAFDTLPSGWSKNDAFQPANLLPINCVFSDPDRDQLRQSLEDAEPALLIARQLVGSTEGGRVIVFLRIPIEIDWEIILQLRLVSGLLRQDAVNAAIEGRTNDAVRSARAGFGVSRAIGSEPLTLTSTTASGASTPRRLKLTITESGVTST